MILFDCRLVFSIFLSFIEVEVCFEQSAECATCTARVDQESFCTDLTNSVS